jgi:hypothetical protein
MTRLVDIEITELSCLEIADDDDGTDALLAYDELDSDDAAAVYQHRTVKVTDRETGEVLPVSEV